MPVRVYDINASGRATVITVVGATVVQVVPGTTAFRRPSIVLAEPDGGVKESRVFWTVSSSLRPPPGGLWVASVRTGEYEVSHVYEVTNGP